MHELAVDTDTALPSPKEYLTPEGAVQVRVSFEDGKVRVNDAKQGAIEITEAQARWLSTELDMQFGGGPQLDSECVVMLSGSITEEHTLRLQRELMKIAFNIQKKKLKNVHVTIFINSLGGQVAQGFPLMDTIEWIRGMGIPVVGVVQSTAYSMAAIILQSCSLRLATRYSRLMLHQVKSKVEDRLEYLQNEVDEVKEMNRRLASVIAERNTAGKNDERFWQNYFRGKDKYLSGEKAIEMGLIDGLYCPLEKLEFSLKHGKK